MFFFFFFSSRRRHTRLQGDWSSDVCSSDLDCRLITLLRLDLQQLHQIDIHLFSELLEREPSLTPGKLHKAYKGMLDRYGVARSLAGLFERLNKPSDGDVAPILLLGLLPQPLLAGIHFHAAPPVRNLSARSGVNSHQSKFCFAGSRPTAVIPHTSR